ncbi:MAG: hypothetical protein B0D88_06275, partial [Candidatus Sedimenticola endophacoides]
GRSRDERRTVGAVTAVALASRFWGLGCPKIFHEVATLLFSYAALSALVNQGLSIAGALVMLAIVVGGGLALLMAVRE